MMEIRYITPWDDRLAVSRVYYERAGFVPSGQYLDNTIGGRALREVRYAYSPPGSPRK